MITNIVLLQKHANKVNVFVVTQKEYEEQINTLTYVNLLVPYL
jgi:hypothetical protein